MSNTARVTQPVVVATGGKLGSGKSYFARFLQVHLQDNLGMRAMVLAFANGVKSAVLRECPNVTFEQVYGFKTTESRRALQEVGMRYRATFGADVWFRDLMTSVRYHFEAGNAHVFIVADLRFLDEARLMHQLGARMILLEAPERTAARLRQESSVPEVRAQLAAHASEMQCELPEFRGLMNAIVPNDGETTEERLRVIVTALGFEPKTAEK